jgi:acyl carrier protein
MNLGMPVVQSERYSAARMRSEEEQGQRWLIVAYLLVLGLPVFAIIERLRMGRLDTIGPWLPFLSIVGLQIGMMCAAWLGHRWARWILFLLLLREALLSFQLVLNFSNAGMVITFSVYLVSLYLVGLSDVGEFVRHQHRKHQMSTGLEPAGLAEKTAFWSLMCPAVATVILLSGQPVPRGGYDAGPLLGLGAFAALVGGIVMGIIGIFASGQRHLVGVLRTAVAGTCLCGILGGMWIWAAAGWPEQLERARMFALEQTKHYLPIQTTVLQIEVAERIKAELGRILNRAPAEFDTRKPLVAQGANDLQIVELVLAVERAFQVKVPDSRIGSRTGEGASALTIDQLANAIAAEMKNKVSTAAYSPD